VATVDQKWTANRFRDRVWLRTVEAAIKNDPNKRDDAPSTYEGFTFPTTQRPL